MAYSTLILISNWKHLIPRMNWTFLYVILLILLSHLNHLYIFLFPPQELSLFLLLNQSIVLVGGSVGSGGEKWSHVLFIAIPPVIPTLSLCPSKNFAKVTPGKV